MRLKRYALTFLLVGAFGISSFNAIAVTTIVKVGSSCSKIGETAVQKSLTYTCVKSGKRLIWSKGVPIAPIVAQDLVLTTPSYIPTPPKGGSDEYRCFLLNPKFAKETYLKSVTITPDNMKVSHHGILYRVSSMNVAPTEILDAESAELGWPCFGDTGIPGATAFTPASPSSWISFWAPGGNFKSYPTGTGMKFNVGDQFILQSHFMVMPGYADNEKKASMKITIEYAASTVAELKTMLVAAPIEVPCAPSESGALCNRDAALADLAKRTSAKAALQETALLFLCGKSPTKPIPSTVSDCSQRVNSSMKIYGVTPHMHQLGKSVTITHTNISTGEVTTLSTRPQWNFDDQRTDWLSAPIAAQVGDRISVTCTYDVGLRSLLPIYKNLSPNYVVWGEGTRDEMCLAIINYTD
ncbi:MAG: hypothetical protein F2775_01885 [Actinobacteria bacterium]|nr:hypothetical protein [Actinomycetota bacterium]